MKTIAREAKQKKGEEILQDEEQKRGNTDSGERNSVWSAGRHIMERIQEFREEMLTELDDLEDMIAENSGIRFH